MGVNRVVPKSDKIPLDLYYLEVFASNGHSQVGSWTFVMVLLALDPPNDNESNEHLFGNCPCESTASSLSSRGFCFKWPLTG